MTETGWSDAAVAKLWDERDAAQQVISDLLYDVGALRSALKPFAKEADRLRNYPDDYPYSIPTTPITVGDLRRAKEAIAKASA